MGEREKGPKHLQILIMAHAPSNTHVPYNPSGLAACTSLPHFAPCNIHKTSQNCSGRTGNELTNARRVSSAAVRRTPRLRPAHARPPALRCEPHQRRELRPRCAGEGRTAVSPTGWIQSLDLAVGTNVPKPLRQWSWGAQWTTARRVWEPRRPCAAAPGAVASHA